MTLRRKFIFNLALLLIIITAGILFGLVKTGKLKLFADAGYNHFFKLRIYDLSVQNNPEPIDMFPQTHHTKQAALLTK